MLGRAAPDHAEHEDVARFRNAALAGDEEAVRRVEQRLAVPALAPTGGVGRHGNVCETELAAHAAQEAQAVATHALAARLMEVGRADPAEREPRRLAACPCAGHSTIALPS